MGFEPTIPRLQVFRDTYSLDDALDQAAIQSSSLNDTNSIAKQKFSEKTFYEITWLIPL